MKKILLLLVVLLAFSLSLSTCGNQIDPELSDFSGNNILFPLSVLETEELGIVSVVWNGDQDRVIAVNIEAVENSTRKNASGIKITSNSHSDAFPGIYFIWDSRQNDNG